MALTILLNLHHALRLYRFINKTFGAGHSVSWLDWLLAGAPWSLTMSVILYFLARKLLPPETEAVEGGSEAIKKALAELGPTTGKEKRLIGISLLLLLFWSCDVMRY